MGLVPKNQSFLRWPGSAAQDYLQLMGPTGGVTGWIDSNGVPQGSLAIGGSSSGVSSSSVTPTGNAFYISKNCPSPNPGNCFQAAVDGQFVTDASFTLGSQQITTSSTDPPFSCPNGVFPCTSGGDVGKVSFGTYNCGDTTAAPCTYAVPQGVITKVIDAHNVLVSIAATHTSNGSTNNVFVWGTDDGSQIVAAFNATVTGIHTGPSSSLQLPCGTMLTGLSPFIVPAAGPTAVAIGVSGCGGGGTMIIPLPKMDCKGGTNGGCLIFDPIHVQSTGEVQPAAHFRDITFYGGGMDNPDSSASYDANTPGISIGYFDLLTNVWVTGWNWNNSTSNIVGIANFGGTLINSGSYAGGYIGCKGGGLNSTVSTMFGGSCGGCGSTSFVPTGTDSGYSTYGVYFNASHGGNGVVVANSASQWRDFGSYMGGPVVNSGTGVSTLNGSKLNQGGTADGALTQSGGVVILIGTNIVSSNQPILLSSGSLFDAGGNQLNGIAPVVPTGGTVFGTASITGVTQTSPNIALTSGWGAGAAVSAVSGNSLAQQFTITAAGAPSASPVITITFPTAFWQTPISFLAQVGGTFGDISNPVPSSQGLTSVIFTFAGTPIAGHTYTFVLRSGT